MGKVDQVGVASMKRHDSCAAMFCVCYPLQQLWGLAAWIDHQHGLISRRGHEGVDAYCQMRRCPRGDRPAQQCRYEVYSPIPSSLLAEMRAEMPRLEQTGAPLFRPDPGFWPNVLTSPPRYPQTYGTKERANYP